MRHTFLIVRHTPAFGHPSQRGDSAAAQYLLNIDNQKDTATNPLSEKGEGTASGRSDSEAMNKNKAAGCVALSDIASEDENGNKKKAPERQKKVAENGQKQLSV